MFDTKTPWAGRTTQTGEYRPSEAEIYSRAAELRAMRTGVGPRPTAVWDYDAADTPVPGAASREMPAGWEEIDVSDLI